MTEKTIPVQLPESTFRKLQKVAEMTYQSIDELLVKTVNAALVAPPDIPEPLANELAAMRMMSDDALMAAVQPSLSAAEQQRLQQLNHTAGERPLTEAETKEQSDLLAAYHRSILRRTQAAALLTQRGHHVNLTMPTAE